MDLKNFRALWDLENFCLYHHAPMDLKNFRPLWDLENFSRPLPRAEGLVKFSGLCRTYKSFLAYYKAPMDLKNFRPLWDLENFWPLPPRPEGLVKFSASVGLRKFLACTTTPRRTCKIFGLCGT